MEFFVYSRQAIEAIKPHEVPHVIISITTTPEDQARLPVNPLTVGFLRQSFYDLEGGKGVEDEHLFSAAQAREMVQFVLGHIEAAAGVGKPVERIVVHCDAGLSRSPGVAAAFAKILNGDDADFFKRYIPNHRVYRMIREAHAGTGSYADEEAGSGD